MTTPLPRPAARRRTGGVAPEAAAGSSATRTPRASAGTRDRPLETEYRPSRPLDLARTVLFQRRGAGDPTMFVDGAVIWRGCRTPHGAAALAIREVARGVVRAAAWGPGAEWAIAQLPALCGEDDDLEGFDASRHPLIAEAHRRNPGLRIGRTDLVFDALAGGIIEQKVTGKQAFGAWRRIVTWYGERTPALSPRPLFAPPTVDGWRRVPSWAWHRAGLEPPQARTLVTAARRGEAIERAARAAASGDERDRVLTSLPGVGLWTSAETRIRAFGDADAVSVGDYHLAHEVGYALTGVRADDDTMLELLAPWEGHRQRVIRLIGASGVREERRGPRVHPEDHRDR